MNEPEDWMGKAQKDMRTAQANFNIEEYEAAAFFCQQAIEKALKAMQIKKTGTFDKTHDLHFLGGKLGIPQSLLRICEEITDYYVETRYPDSYAAFGQAEVLESLTKAEKVVGMDKKKLLARLRHSKEKLAEEKKVERMILFGSYAEGRAGKWSDVDLIIVSSLFKGKKHGRSEGLRQYFDLGLPMDILCYTPDEFKGKASRITIVKEALERGIDV